MLPEAIAKTVNDFGVDNYLVRLMYRMPYDIIDTIDWRNASVQHRVSLGAPQGGSC